MQYFSNTCVNTHTSKNTSAPLLYIYKKEISFYYEVNYTKVSLIVLKVIFVIEISAHCHYIKI